MENSNGDSSKITNGKTNGTNGDVTGDGDKLNSRRKFSKRDEELVRLIGQHLLSVGLENSARTLVKESDTTFENTSASLFRQSILDGDWENAFSALNQLQYEIKKKNKVTQMKFYILEQKFLELLEDGDCIGAFQCLRGELAPLKVNEERLAKLAQVIMLKDPKQIRAAAGWQGKGRSSRQLLMDNLQHYLPHNVMLPPRRLQTLLKQAQLYQQSQSLCTNINQQSLLYDAQPPQKEIPEQCCQTLYEHKDEVTICKFSNDGKYLATGSKDQTVIIWSIDDYSAKLAKKFELGRPVCYLMWSPNDKMLLITGNEDSSSIWIYDVESGDIKEHKQATEDSITTCAWLPDNKRYLCAGKQGQFYMVDVASGQVIEQWEGIRVYGIHCIGSDGSKVLASDSRNRIRCYDWECVLDHPVLEEDHSILSFSVSKDENYALLNIKQQGLHLWDIKCNSLVRRFRGNKQDYFVIYSCFGGSNEEFFASGSEDNLIYIYHREKETPINRLEGHTKPVTCVDWHSSSPGLLASGGDDCLVKLWKPSVPESSDEESDEDED